MELLRTSRRANNFGDLLHIVAQVGFVILIGLLVLAFQLPAVAFLLALLSKWRIFAVRPRYWRANVITNLIDVLFLVGVTALIIKPLVLPTTGGSETAGTTHTTAIFLWLTVLAVWQIWLKPQTSQPMMFLQAGIGQFVALTALCSYVGMTPELSAMNQISLILLVIGAWVIGYAAARHVISSFDGDEPRLDFFAHLWGLVLAMMAWLFGHWMHVYILTPELQIPQFALIALLVGFCAVRAYDFQRRLNVDKSIARVRTKQKLRTLYITGLFSGLLLILVIASTRWSVSL